MDSFNQIGLAPSVNFALKKLGYKKPTAVQESVIPLALEGKDILMKSRTGSGKTLAYLIPILSKLTASKSLGSVQALIVAPTKELCKQIAKVCNDILMFVRDSSISIVNLAEDDCLDIQKSSLLEKPSVLVSTPSASAQLFNISGELLSRLEFLVIDEADLVLQMGYLVEIQIILSQAPRSCQFFIVSATLDEKIEDIRSLFLKNVATVKVTDDVDNDLLKQYYLSCKDNDEKLLILTVLFKLKLLNGKVLIYVKSADQGYLLKILLSRFSIKSHFLNPEHPVVSRLHTIEEFNSGVINILICHEVDSDKEGTTRGLDLKRVDLVLVFDLPEPNIYTHQVGRTARGGLSGTSLVLFDKSEESLMTEIVKDQLKSYGKNIRPFDFDISKVEGFRYRVLDAIRSVTKASIKDAKLADIKLQMTNSEKITAALGSSSITKNSVDLHESENAKKLKSLMKSVPEYLLRSGKDGSSIKMEQLSIPLKPSKRSLKRQAKRNLKKQAE